MACNCEGTIGCDCTIISGPGILIEGRGTGGEPYRVTNTRSLAVADTPSLDLTYVNGVVTGKVRLDPVLKVADTDTVDMTVTGAGTEASPFTLAAAIKGLILSAGNTGDHLQKQPDGTWAPGPANQVPPGPGLPSTSGAIIGDGTGGKPIRVKVGLTYEQWEAAIDGP